VRCDGHERIHVVGRGVQWQLRSISAARCVHRHAYSATQPAGNRWRQPGSRWVDVPVCVAAFWWMGHEHADWRELLDAARSLGGDQHSDVWSRELLHVLLQLRRVHGSRESATGSAVAAALANIAGA
jgi:hypothetical protein